MTEKLISLIPFTFDEVEATLKNNPDKITFLRDGTSKAITIPIKVDSPPSGNENNIVSKWMDEITQLCRNALDGKVDKTITMNAIYAYCMAVKTSVTTS